MQRLKDYGGFGLWFLGLGYIVSMLAGDAYALPPLVQLFGLFAAIAVLVQLLLIALRDRRGPRNAQPQDGAKSALRRRRPDPTVMRIKARNHFGLRGTER